MDILILNQDWFAEEWREAGHRVVTAGLAEHLDLVLGQPFIHVDSIIKLVGDGFQPDRIVVHDNSSPLMFTGLDETPIPCLFYSVDTHHHWELHRYLYNVFDEMYVAQKDYLRDFHAMGMSPRWLPLWASREVDASPARTHGAVFVGSLNPDLNPERVQFFDELKTRVPLLCTTGEYWKIFPFSELVVNQTVKGDLNFRVFEAMMCGTLLLTEESSNGLRELFTDDHLATYTKNNVAEAAERIQYFLDRPKLARELGQAGREEILRHHLPKHRAAVILERLLTLEKGTSVQKSFSAMINFSLFAQRLLNRGQSSGGQGFVVSMKCLHDGLERSEEMNNELAWYAIGTCYGYDRVTHGRSGEQMIKWLHDAYPNICLFSYALVRNCLNLGDLDEARKLARAISDEEPENVFSLSDALVSKILGVQHPSS